MKPTILKLDAKHGPIIATAVIVVLAVASLRIEGHSWWCKLGGISPWSGNVHSPHNSQHLLDPYTLTHLLHGILFYGSLTWAVPRVPNAWRMVIALALESIWEIAENTQTVIERYRAATISLGYNGDSILNSLGDIAACALGYVLAARIGPWKSLAIIAVVEIGMLFWIRDNLTLNVVMLVYPIEAVKVWQSGQ